MKCPKCGSRGYCYAGNKRKDGVTIRYYVCRECNAHFSTEEKIVRVSKKEGVYDVGKGNTWNIRP